MAVLSSILSLLEHHACVIITSSRGRKYSEAHIVTTLYLTENAAEIEEYARTALKERFVKKSKSARRSHSGIREQLR